MLALLVCLVDDLGRLVLRLGNDLASLNLRIRYNFIGIALRDNEHLRNSASIGLCIGKLRLQICDKGVFFRQNRFVYARLDGNHFGLGLNRLVKACKNVIGVGQLAFKLCNVAVQNIDFVGHILQEVVNLFDFIAIFADGKALVLNIGRSNCHFFVLSRSAGKLLQKKEKHAHNKAHHKL